MQILRPKKSINAVDPAETTDPADPADATDATHPADAINPTEVANPIDPTEAKNAINATKAPIAKKPLETGFAAYLVLDPPEDRYTIDEAVELIGRVLLTLESVEDFRLKLKWCLGHLVYYTEYRPRRRRQTLEILSKRLHEVRQIPACITVLYECLNLFTYFDGRLYAYEVWIADRKKLYDRQVYWSDIKREIFGGGSNPRIIGREEADLRDMRAVEHGIEALDRLVSRAHADTVELDDERRGVIAGLRQSMEALALLPHSATETIRSDEYLAYVRKHGCIVCSKQADAHHAFGPHGLQQKASDFTCVPLCRVHHAEIHQAGKYSFEDGHDVNLFEIAFNLIHRFLTGSWVTLQLDEINWALPGDIPSDAGAEPPLD